MKPLHFIIKRPLLSEKVTKQGKIKIIAFEVAEDASKIAIKEAVEKAFTRHQAVTLKCHSHSKYRQIAECYIPDNCR